MKLNRIETVLATGIYLFALVLIFSNEGRAGVTRSAASLVGYATIIYGSYLAFTQWMLTVFVGLRITALALAFTIAISCWVQPVITARFWVNNYEQDVCAHVMHIARRKWLVGALLGFL